MLKIAFFFGLLALAHCALPIGVSVPPDCPQRLAAAQQAILDADKQIATAVDNLNKTGPVLDRAVDDAAATKSQASQNLNTATNKDNTDRSILANDQASLQNAKNNLTNIQNNCKSPAPPTNCNELIAEAEATIGKWNNVIDRDMATIQNDDAIVAYDTQLLKQAADGYDAAVATRTAKITLLQQAIQQAIDTKAAAQKNLEDIERECQLNALAPPADCPTALDQAQKAVAAAGEHQKQAIDAYNTEMPKLDANVDQAANSVSAANSQLAAAQSKQNHDQSVLANDQAHLMDAQNNLRNIQTTCGGPTPPIDCSSQIAAAKAKIQDLTVAVNADSSLVAADVQTIARDASALTNAKSAYDSAVQYRDATRVQMQKVVDDAAAAYNTAQANYEEIERQCQQLVQ